MVDNYTLSKITSQDKTAIKELAVANGGNANLTEDYIEHWYFNNPSNSNALWKVVVDDKMEGYATTNNFIFNIKSAKALVAMPQNVLTSQKIRGKGLFNKLYFKTEWDNIENNHIDYFLTFTNSMSTQIFLNKFGYTRGKCPIVSFTVFNVFDLFSKKKIERIHSVNEINSAPVFSFENAAFKTEQHIKWRYSNYPPDALHIISVKDGNYTTGYAVLKIEKKKGIKFLILMDIITERKENFPFIIESCFVYSSKQLYAGVLMFNLPVQVRSKLLRLEIKDRFNFLVKGKSAESTTMLSNTDFTFFFGDLDIL